MNEYNKKFAKDLAEVITIGCCEYIIKNLEVEEISPSDFINLIISAYASSMANSMYLLGEEYTQMKPAVKKSVESLVNIFEGG